jgi:hypothetical protein
MFCTGEGKHNEQSSQRLRPQRRMKRSTPTYLLLSTPMSSSFRGDWSHHPSLTMNPPCWERNLPSVMLGNGETGARTCNDITKQENGPTQPVSRDEVSEVGETPDERAHRERRNSRHRDRRQAQERERELAQQDARLQRENPLLAQNLYPNFTRSLNTPSEVGGVLAQIADGLSWTPDAEGYWRLLTQAANHLLPLTHPPNDLCHTINSRQDMQSNISASCDRQHENEIRHWDEYDRDHGVPARSRATRIEPATASTNSLLWGRSRRPNTDSPPQDRRHDHRQEDTCGVSALTPRLRAIQWPPNFKVSNVDKYEPKQDPGGCLVIYTTAAQAARAT